MSHEILTPFSVAPNGSIAIESNPDRQIAQHVRALVTTEPTERVMRNAYGVPTASTIFEPDDDFTKVQLLQKVTQALAYYEPGVKVHSVTPVPNNEGDGVAGVQVHYTRTESARSPQVASKHINVAYVSSGGHVSEVIRG